MINPNEDYKQIIEAVKIIKRVCEYHKGSCYNCPYGLDMYTCGIVGKLDNKPKDWKIPPFRAFEVREEKQG